MKKRHAEIAGGGLAGLMTAARLAQLGWSVRLHERSDDLRMFGAGIWLWENGLKALRAVGAYEGAVHRAKEIREWRIADGAGNVLMTRSMTPGDGLLLPPRADLYEALIQQVKAFGVDIELSSEAVAADPDGTLILANGRELKADLVVAADGIGSRIRDRLLCTSWVDYGRQGGIRMLIDRQTDEPDDIITEYWEGTWRLLYNPCTDGQDYIFLSAPIDDRRANRVPVDRDLWTRKFPRAERMIARFAEAGRWDQIGNVRCRTWSAGKVAIIGDAAHAMPPNLGQAANMAFTNAMALAHAVTRETDVAEALRMWESEARPLTDHVQWFSYIYDFVLAKWPSKLYKLRNDAIRTLAGTEWFEDALNRGARTTPAGYTS